MMKKLKLALLIVFLAVGVVFGVGFYAVLQFAAGEPGLIMPDEKKAEKLLAERYETIHPVAEAMLSIDSYYIRWDTFDENLAKVLSISREGEDGRKINIDESVDVYGIEEYTEEIRKYKIWHIVKHDNYISFVLWSSLGSSCSLVYCKSGKPEIVRDGENYISSLSEKNWYYYRHVSD